MGSKAGFTFLEVLIAVCIMAILLIGIHKLQTQMVSMNQFTQFYSVAPLLAQSKLSEIARQNFKETQQGSGNFGNDYPGYEWSVSTEIIESEILNKLAYPMLRIDLSVLLNHGERSYHLRSYRYLDIDVNKTATVHFDS